jgi:hypothetical protein
MSLEHRDCAAWILSADETRTREQVERNVDRQRVGEASNTELRSRVAPGECGIRAQRRGDVLRHRALLADVSRFTSLSTFPATLSSAGSADRRRKRHIRNASFLSSRNAVQLVGTVRGIRPSPAISAASNFVRDGQRPRLADVPVHRG